MRLTTGAVLLLAIPGILFLGLWPLVGCRWAWLPAALWIVLMIYGFFFGWRHLVVRSATCASPLLPQAFDGYRVVQLSDIHIGTFLRNRSFVDRLVQMVNAQRPDVVVFTGDLVNVGPRELLPFRQVLSQITAPDGVFAVMGNHDYCEYGDDRSTAAVRRSQTLLQHLERKMGWRVLMNEHATIRRGDASIEVVGVENISRPPFPAYGDLQKALEGTVPGTFKMLLSHDPSHWRRGVLRQTDIALTLSGHTHAGQMSLGRLSPVKWAYNEWGGKYTEAGSMLYVSVGIGGTVPFRFGAWPGIDVITLRRA